MADTRRMHTVPASYLDAFAFTEGRRTSAVWRYSRSEREPVAVGIYDAAVWKDIYAFEDETGQRSTGIENSLAEVEGAFCEARKVLTAGAVPTLDQRMAVARFIAFQLLRTPRSLQLNRDEWARVTKHEVLALAADRELFHAAMGDKYESEEACEVARQSLGAGRWHFEADAFTGLYFMMHRVSEMALWVTLMDWTAYTSDGGYSLLTSDNPVTLWAERVIRGHVGTEVGVGFVDPALRLSFPVTPLLSLVAEHTPFPLIAINAEDLGGLRAWQPQFRHQVATPIRLKVLNHATVTNSERYVYHRERDAKVERFLRQYLLNQPAPVRPYDRKAIGTPT